MARTYTGSLDTASQVGIVRDVADMINNLDRDETPFIREAGRGKNIKSTVYEWEVERLPTYDPDRDVEQGHKATPTSTDQPDFLQNHTMLFEDSASVTTTARRTRQYNIPEKKKMAREVRRKTTAMKIAQNKRCLGNYGSQSAESNAGVGKFGSVLAMLTGDRLAGGAGHSKGGYNKTTKVFEPYAKGTARALTEDLFNSTVKEIGRNRKATNYDAFMNIDAKNAISNSFDGIAQLTQEVGAPKKAIGLQGTVGFIKTDQGVVALHYDHTAPDDTIAVLDMDLWSLHDLDPWKTQDLGVIGLSKEKQCWNETTLKGRNPEGSGALVDLTFA